MGFRCLVRDQEVDGSNPFTPTNLVPKSGELGKGLLASSQLVKMMGGKMWLRERVQLGKDILPKSACMPLEELRGLPVLIVDDNLTHLQSLTGMVDSYGMATTAVISA